MSSAPKQPQQSHERERTVGATGRPTRGAMHSLFTLVITHKQTDKTNARSKFNDRSRVLRTSSGESPIATYPHKDNTCSGRSALAQPAPCLSSSLLPHIPARCMPLPIPFSPLRATHAHTINRESIPPAYERHKSLYAAALAISASVAPSSSSGSFHIPFSLISSIS